MKKRLCALLLAGLMILATFPPALADYEDLDGDGVWTIRDELLANGDSWGDDSSDGLPSWYDPSMDVDSAWDDRSTGDTSAWGDDSSDGLPSWYDPSMDGDSAWDDRSTGDTSAWDDNSTDALPSWYDPSMDVDSAAQPARDDGTTEEYPWLIRSDDGVTDAGNTTAVDGRDTGATEEYPWLSIQDNGESVVAVEPPAPDRNGDGVINGYDALTGLPDSGDTETASAEETTETEYIYDSVEEDTELQDLLKKERLEEVKDAESARQALLDLMESMNKTLEARAEETNPDNEGDNSSGSSGGGTSSPPNTTEPEPVDDTWEWESSEADDLLAVYTEAVTAQAATEYVESADVVIDRESVLKLVRIHADMEREWKALNEQVKAEVAASRIIFRHDGSTADESVDPLVISPHVPSQSDTKPMSIIATIRSRTLQQALSKRAVNKTVVFSSAKTDITIRIEPDLRNIPTVNVDEETSTTVDKIQVKTPSYALTFTIADLKPDLHQALIIRCREAGSMDAESGGSKIVEVDLPNGKLTNPFTVSMPAIDGNVTYQTLASVQGASAYSGDARNADTDDYRWNHDVELMAGSKTKAIPSKENPATKNMEGRTAESGRYTNINNPKDFTDIANKSAEMQKAIRYLASKGIINGTSDTTFSPDNSITRAHIVALIMRGLGKVDNSLQAHFKDVPSTAWYYHELASSERLNIINGFSDGTFRGNNTINKAQITTVAGRLLVSEMKYKAPEGPEKSKHLKKFKDEVPGYAQDMVALATREDLIVYRKDGTFAGGELMTRGDAAILLYRLFKRIWY